MRLVLALVVVGFASFFLKLGSIGLIGPDESRYAQVARDMMERADWVTPKLQGEPWLDKPPLYYWAAAGSMRLLGETEAALRLPSALAASATCLAVACIGAWWFGFATGLRSALVLSASLGMILYGRAAIMDALLTLALTIGLGAYALYVTTRPSVWWLLTASVALGFGFLAKGPIAIALPLLIVVPFHWLEHRRGTETRRPTLPGVAHLALSLMCFLAVVMPWHVAILEKTGWEYVEIFFLQNNVDRFFTTVHRHPGPFYYYLPVLGVALLPWSGFAPAAIVRAVRAVESRRLFLLLWIAMPLLFFSVSRSKLPGYVLPVLPPFALLIGLLWKVPDGSETPAVTWLNRSLLLNVAWCMVLGAAAVHGVMGRAPDLVTAGRWLAALLVGLAAATYLVGRRRPGTAFWTSLITSLGLTLFLVHYLAPKVEPYQSLKTLASKGLSVLKPGERIICYKAFYPQAHFYARDRLGEIWTLEEFRNRAADWGRIVSLTEPGHYRELQEEESLETLVIARAGNRILIEVQPHTPVDP